ncbi:Alpha/beta hydrolase family protein [compost metagenome]
MRFDKRGVAASQPATPDERDLSVEQYVADVIAWSQKLKADPRFGPLILIGHSEGALIASLAAEPAGASAVIALAGSGRPIADVLREQLAQRLPAAQLARSSALLDRLQAGQTSLDVPAPLRQVFRPSVQPYLISLFRQNPAAAFAQLPMPALIVQGRNDVQVDVSDAERLKAAKPDAQLVLIDGMNHMLRISPAGMSQQRDSYLNPELPLARELGERIVTFIKHLPQA